MSGTGIWRARTALVMGLLLLGLVTPRTAAAQAGWSLLELPGGRAGLLPRLGMAADVPRAMVLGEIIRVVHASRDPAHPPLVAVGDYFRSPPADGAEDVPVPVSPQMLRTMLGRDVPDGALLGALLQDRRASLVCYGLLGMDPPTRAVIAEDQTLLRRLYEHHAGLVAAFGDVLVVADGRLRLPGGPGRAAVWESLLGEPLGSPERALTAMLSKDDGRLAYFIETVTSLDEAQLASVFGIDPAPEPSTEHARAVYSAFVDIEPAWRPADHPFLRVGSGPALLLAALRPSPDGLLRTTQRFWLTLLRGEQLPAEVPERWTLLDAGPRVHPAWLLRELTPATLSLRQSHAVTYHFASRTIDRLPDRPIGEIVWLTLAFQRYPALLLALERLEVQDQDVVRRLVRKAGQIAATDIAAAEIALALYQAPIALVGRLVRSRALSTDAAERVLASLADLDPATDRYGQSVARWLEEILLPSVGYDPTSEGAIAEGALLEALAGLRAPADAAAPDAVTWESYTYRVDAAAPELMRLTEVRTRQGGNTLDTALALCRAGRAVAEARDLTAVRALEAALAPVRGQLQPIEAGERRGATPPAALQAWVEQALEGLARIRSRGDLRRAQAVGARLSRAGDAALADVLTSLVYALWLGDPQGQIFLAGNVARRHDYGLSAVANADRASIAWSVPVETSGSGDPWHVRGALLGLDIGLARLGLRRTRMDLPEAQPTLNENDRRTFVTTLALTEPAALLQREGEQLAKWLGAGRALAATPAVIGRLDQLALDGHRRQAILWAAAAAAHEVPRLLLLTELVQLGRDGDTPVSPAWGMAETQLTGALRLQFPEPPALRRYAGRAGSGMLTTRIADLKLRVLELLVTHRLPVVLTRAVLASAMQDFLDEARPAHGDDWHALLRAVERLPVERFEDYVAALTAGGPLVPLGAPAPTNGHE